MNYSRIYDELINKRIINRPESNVKTENHHIIPKCLGGSDDESNIVTLTCREHLFAHILLFKIHPNNYKITLAFFAMCVFVNKGTYRRSIPNTRILAVVKEAAHKAMSEKNIGSGNPRYDSKLHTFVNRKTGERITATKYDFVALTEISRSHINFLFYNNHRHVKDWGILLSDGSYSFDRKIVQPKAKKKQCPHCLKWLSGGNLNRWHNDKCKLRTP